MGELNEIEENIKYENSGEKEKYEKYENTAFGKATKEIFFELEKYLEKNFFELKEELKNNICPEEKEIFIETILVPSNEVYKYDGCYFEINSDKNFEILEEIYANISFNRLKDFEKRKFYGWLKINDENYEVEVLVSRNEEYFNKLKRLYNSFILNGKEWKTVNLTHFIRMFDIKLYKYEFDLTKEIFYKLRDKEYELIIDFEEYEKYIVKDKKLLWNVEEKQILSSMFVKPSKRNLSFEYNISFNDDEIILIEGISGFYNKNEKNDILFVFEKLKNKKQIISKVENIEVWDIFSIKDIDKCRKNLEINNFFSGNKFFENKINVKENLEYENNLYKLFTNYKKITFFDKLRKKYYKNQIKTRAYLEKIFYEYDFITNEINFIDINFNKKYYEYAKTYNMNDIYLEEQFKDIVNLVQNIGNNRKEDNINKFSRISEMLETAERLERTEKSEKKEKSEIVEESAYINSEKTMNIIVKITNRNIYTEDKLSFLMTELQQKIPGYRIRVIDYEEV